MLKKQNNSLSHTCYEILKLKSLNPCAKYKAFIKLAHLRVGKAVWGDDQQIKIPDQEELFYWLPLREKKKIIN